MPEEITLIQSAEVVRDEYGYWWHPELPEFDEGDEERSKAWVKEQGLSWVAVHMEYEVDTDTDPYFNDGGPDCSHWTPNRPDGEGWFVLAIS